MRDRPAEGFDRSGRSLFCTDGEHEDCPHAHGIEYGVNPLRLRPESGVLLCTCDCHSSCPVTSKRRTVPVQAWRESCICPAAGDMRARLDRRRDSSEDTGPPWEYSEARVEALNAARDRAAGMGRDQVKDLYKAELRARGLAMPPEPLVDVDVSLITGDFPRAWVFFGRSLAGLAKLLSGARPPRAEQ